MKGIEIRVKGKVQGVGFRPFVWQLAHQLNLTGEVLNDGEGVLIRLASPLDDREPYDTQALQHQFQTRLCQQLPPLARIDSLSVSDFHWQRPPEHFEISPSVSNNVDTEIVPDAATCSDCLQELTQPRNRRYQYPFINCTHCGPRFTIIQALPYDRPNTVMRDFPLCPDCTEEYKNPADRRYHAQPVACDTCGPRVWITDNKGTVQSGHWLELAASALQRGEILAIKSIGGFHLACNASNAEAVQTLRNRKQRQHKPFAVMVADSATAEEYARISQAERDMLASRIAPIVLLKKKDAACLADNIAPGLTEIGIMLPSNPLQHLLITACDYPLVMTSANASGYPPAIDNTAALTSLNTMADWFVMHNRDIVQRCDDSLLRVNYGKTEVLRRSRGLVPDALALPDGFPDVDGFLAYGGDLKNAFAVGKGHKIIVSQYLGDLANVRVQKQHLQTIKHYLSLYHINVHHHVTDLHSGYFSYQFASQHCDKPSGYQLTRVQHHHAHVASCLIEHGWAPKQGKVLALALDGLGLGNDNTFWGGELLIADYHTFRQIGGLPAVTMLGGDSVAKEPWRSFYSHIRTFAPDISDAELETLLPGKPIHQLDMAFARQVNCHSVRSAGRLFDAVAYSLGITAGEERMEYEGQAACLLEALALQCEEAKPSPELHIPSNGLTLDLPGFWQQWLKHDGSPAEKARLFHDAFAQALADIVTKAQGVHRLNHLVLTGGVFHNTLLTSLVKAKLPDTRILQHHKYSCGDGGLALGQLAVAACQASQRSQDA
ncbi:carbamoyltransferase HypF [Vibrio albus]|uniref:Carbamoyltransferase HypF n=1 Tax=Vibrio albus TaxID=2200953 RepID=A0A2U3BB60_9VIBR|nr:carbamoyltransferase HypF [Vibrio albus]PWI33965.1 carbamoyltransferase HypF [Vibrio albus]